MITDDTTPQLAGRSADLRLHAVPEDGAWRCPPADRLVRQVQAIDAWIAARREREQVLRATPMSRDQRMDAQREIEGLRRTHDAIRGRCARGLDAELEPMQWPCRTAVIAHCHAWFVDKLAQLLDEHGVSVLACTDNGAEALGAVVAEQPDLVLVGDRLAMMPGRALLTQARRYAPDTLLAAQGSHPDDVHALRSLADSVFLSQRPSAIADALTAHLTAQRMTTGDAGSS